MAPRLVTSEASAVLSSSDRAADSLRLTLSRPVLTPPAVRSALFQFRPLKWRTEHPYLLADRLEDMTPDAAVQEDPKCNRDVCLYG